MCPFDLPVWLLPLLIAILEWLMGLLQLPS